MTELQLIFTTGPHQGLRYSSAGGRVRIGRSRDNDIVLADDGTPDASRHHAEAVLERGSWWIVDLGAANGTRVNGRRVQRERLRDGDRVELGAHVLSVRVAAPERRRAVVPLALVLPLALAAALLWLLLRIREPGGFEAAARRVVRATYLVGTENAARRMVVGTAFAVSADGLLATNAHVAREVQRRVGAGQRALAIRSEPEEDLRPITALWPHPRWTPGSIRDDVALLRVAAGPPTTSLPLAGDDVLQHLDRGTPVALFGFPAISTDPERPRGRLTVDVVGDIRSARYFAVGLHIGPGTSGSPIFLPDGTVVALAAGGDFLPVAGGVTPAGSGVNWGVSVSALREVIASVEPQSH